MNYLKGQIGLSHLIGWGVTIVVATIGYTMSQINKVADAQSTAQTSIVQRVSVVETESQQYQRDIADINKKLDTLISKAK